MNAFQSSPMLIDQVYEVLLAKITLGVLEPGQRIRQSALAAQFGVSRQPISHALQLLRRQGLIREAGRQGVEITPIDPHQLRQLYQVRTVLEGLAARLAAERVAAGAASGEDRQALEAALQDGQAVAARTRSTADLAQADVAFHKALYRLCGNPSLEETLAGQWPHFMRAMVVALQDPGLPPRAWSEHAAIAQRILAGDAAAAEQIASAHTARAGLDVEAWLHKVAVAA